MARIRYEQKTVNLAIDNGQSLDQGKVKLPAGKCIGMAAVMAGTKPTVFVNLGISENGVEIVQPSDWQFFEKTNGGTWLASLRNMSFDCDRDVTVDLSAAAALAADFKLQVIFIIEQVIG